MGKGTKIGHPVVNVKVTINDGQSHSVDSSEMAFQAAGRGAFRQAYERAKPTILEPVMRVSVEGPSDHNGAILGTLMSRRGNIVGTQEMDGYTRVEAEVPLAEMFGYATTLRSNTQGKAEFTMEFSRYLPVPMSVAEELIKKAADEKKGN